MRCDDLICGVVKKGSLQLVTLQICLRNEDATLKKGSLQVVKKVQRDYV